MNGKVNDFISRRQAIGALNDEYHGMISDESMKIYQIINWISALPSAHPQRKKGKWINDCTCSVCHWIHEDYKGFALVTNYNFCPRCGARMEGESE